MDVHRAEEAYHLRSTGEAWESIAGALGYQTGYLVKTQVQRHAEERGWEWPIPPEREGRFSGYTTRHEAAYKFRVRGLKWQGVGAKIGLFSPYAHAIAIRHARRYASTSDLPWPPEIDVSKLPLPENGELAYDLRMQGLSWSEVGRKTSLGTHAPRRAERYAQVTGKPWPVPALTMAEIAYQIKHDNPDMAWRFVAKRAGYRYGDHATTGARRVAFARTRRWMRTFLADYGDATSLAAAAWEAVGLHAGDLTEVPPQVLLIAKELIPG